MGRPVLPAGKARGEILTVRLTPDERKRINTASKRAGKNPTVWARDNLLQSADDVIKNT